LVTEYEASLPSWGWPNWVVGNHDSPRIAARIGEAQARVAAMLLLTLRGTPTLYQGDELGLGLIEIPADKVRDPRELRQPAIGLGRDPARTPIPWNATANAGFTGAEPWLPLNPDWPMRNVAAQERDPGSMLALYRRLLALRREHPALSVGGFHFDRCSEGVLTYRRECGEERLLIALNFTAEGREIADVPGGELLASTLSPDEFGGTLRGNEGVVLRLANG
jgi:oligo-1,6-glucosidase/alpha-glucosidase